MAPDVLPVLPNGPGYVAKWHAKGHLSRISRLAMQALEWQSAVWAEVRQDFWLVLHCTDVGRVSCAAFHLVLGD